VSGTGSTSLADPTVAELLARLHRNADEQRDQVRAQVGAPGDQEMGPAFHWERLKDFYLPVSREQGVFLYQTVRAIRARRVVEFGSSFGISSIYLAAALRDQAEDGRAEFGMVIGSELIREKAEGARANLATAGLSEYVEIRIGDARTTLVDPGGTIDLVLLDGGPAAYLDVLHLLQPHLRPGAVVIADNIDSGSDELHPYAAWIRDPANGFVSSSITLKGGTEYSVWIG